MAKTAQDRRFDKAVSTTKAARAATEKADKSGTRSSHLAAARAHGAAMNAKYAYGKSGAVVNIAQHVNARDHHLALARGLTRGGASKGGSARGGAAAGGTSGS